MTKLLYYDQDSRRIRAMTHALLEQFDVSVASNLLELALLLKEQQPSIVLLGFVTRDTYFNIAHLDGIRRVITHAFSYREGKEGLLTLYVLHDESAKQIMSSCARDNPWLSSLGMGFSILNSIPCAELRFLELPKEIETLPMLITESMEHNDRISNSSFNAYFRAAAAERCVPIIGKSTKIRAMLSNLRICAKTNQSILFLGETGTGKELAARTLHMFSRKKNEPFIALNCAAIPEALFESEMFGTERGAYTDASARRGALEEANEGTLFLDEIGSLSPGSQPRLLRVLETGEFRRLGSPSAHASHFRLVSASCLNPIDMAVDHKFRNDLLFRIANTIIEIPPLRERIEDIPLLARHFGARFSKDGCAVSDDALEKLADHDWPGNVRELQAVIARACVLQKTGTIHAKDIEFLSGISKLAPKAG